MLYMWDAPSTEVHVTANFSSCVFDILPALIPDLPASNLRPYWLEHYLSVSLPILLQQYRVAINMSLPRNDAVCSRPMSDYLRERHPSSLKSDSARTQSKRSASDPTHLTTNAIHDRRYRWALEMLEADPKLAPFVNRALTFMHSFETRDSKNLQALDNLIVEGREITRRMEDVRKSSSRSDRTEEQLDEMVKVLQQMTMIDKMG